MNSELSYDIVANNAVLAAFIDDGYSGHKRKINLSLVDSVWYEVTETGYYKAPDMWSDRYSDIHQIHDGQTL